ncbi:MAG: thrombospondin type 3 repeat-containing protein [Dehalococcoidia bacterium]|nr:thrombospondin type 3 repeat-containing protein [Dehalococcoidia bacterium]
MALVAGTVIGLLAIVLVLSGADSSRADFNPTYTISVANPQAGAHSPWTSAFDVPKGNVNFAGVVFFINSEWDITPGEDIPIGAIVGQLTAQATLGLINAPCANPLPVGFTMLNASIDPNDTVDYLDTDDNGTEDYAEDLDQSGLQDGFEKYPDFITRALVDENDKPLTPIRRSAGIAIVAGINVLLQFLVFEPGTFIDEHIPSDESLGYPSVTLLQNVGDPATDPIPGPITDFCTSLASTNISLGVSKDNPCTTTSGERLDPLCEVLSAILIGCDDSQDSDTDKKANDGCPTVGGEAETACDDEVDDDGDGWVNDGCPAIEDPEDSTVTDPDESGVALFTNPAEGTYEFTTIALGQRDADGDGYENSLDTCPFVANLGDPRVTADADEDTDGLDAACDPNPDPAAGGTNSDEDLDGYMNRGDNCPQEPNGESGDNQRDTDDDQIGDACDPNPEDADPQGELAIANLSTDVTIGPGGPSTDQTPSPTETPSDGDDGGGATIFIIIAIAAGVVVLGGGAFYFMRRGGGGGGGTT